MTGKQKEERTVSSLDVSERKRESGKKSYPLSRKGKL